MSFIFFLLLDFGLLGTFPPQKKKHGTIKKIFSLVTTQNSHKVSCFKKKLKSESFYLQKNKLLVVHKKKVFFIYMLVNI